MHEKTSKYVLTEFNMYQCCLKRLLHCQWKAIIISASLSVCGAVSLYYFPTHFLTVVSGFDFSTSKQVKNIGSDKCEQIYIGKVRVVGFSMSMHYLLCASDYTGTSSLW